MAAISRTGPYYQLRASFFRNGSLFIGWLVIYSGVLLSPALSLASDMSMQTHTQTKTMPHVIRTLKVDNTVNAVTWNADGSLLAALSDYGSVITVWDTKTWSIFKEFKRYGGAYSGNSFAFLKDGSLITSTPVGKSPDPKYTDLSTMFSLIQWDVSSGTPLRYFPAPNSAHEKRLTGIGMTNTFTVSKDGTLIAGIGPQNVVLVYNARTTALLYKLRIPIEWAPVHKFELIESLAFSPDGKELAIGTVADAAYKPDASAPGGALVHIFDAHTGKPLRYFWAYKKDSHTGDLYDIRRLAFSPDGKYIATGKRKAFNTVLPDDIAISIWKAHDGTLVSSLEGKTTDFTGKTEVFGTDSLSWYADILASGEGSALRLWSMNPPSSPKLIGVIDPSPTQVVGGALVYSTAFSKNGLLAFSLENEITILQFR